MTLRHVDRHGFDPRALVADGYERCGSAYSAARSTTPPASLPLFADRIPVGAAVLDIGCGSGLPVTAALAARFSATGINIAAGQIERARQNVPRARFVHADIMTQVFVPESFAGVVMIYALFHLPRQEQPALLRRIGTWLRPRGLLLATLAQTSDPGYVESDFHGTTMYWSHFSEPEYDPILDQAGFEVLERRRIGHGYADSTRDA
jgi:SAM-dependent methyltransferase